jgi:uncharacterized protein
MSNVKPLFLAAAVVAVAMMCLAGVAEAATAMRSPQTATMPGNSMNANVGGQMITPAPAPKQMPVASDGTVEQVTERYPNGKIKIERQVTKDAAGNYVNNGVYTRYDADGKVQSTGAYLNGKQHGPWTQTFVKDEGHLFLIDREGEFHGPFVSQVMFNEGQLDGVWTIKDRGGQNIVEWTFDNGVRNGKWTWWYANGQKRLEATYVNGKLEGDEMEWGRDGKLIAKNTFINGRHLTATVGWYTLGQKHYEGYYLSVVKMPEATYDWWNSTVTTAATTPTGEDLQHGAWIEWYPSGNKKTEARYDHGVAMGRFVWWYENGQKQAEVDYEAGAPNGVWVTWHPNGQKESQAEYHNGQLIGQWMHWDANGKLIGVKNSNGNMNMPQDWNNDQRTNRAMTRQVPPTMRSR